MQDKDVITKEFFLADARVADFINGFLFEGHQLVRPEDIKEADSAEFGKTDRLGRFAAHRKYRDIIRRVMLGARFALVGIEDQSQIHYAMPVRAMGYDFLGYDKQLTRLRKQHSSQKDLQGEAEFLSGLSSGEKLDPTVTIVLYYGEEPWTGPRCLHDMLRLEDFPEQFRQFVNDYPIHIFEVNRFKHLEYFQTDLRLVFGFLQNRSDHGKLKQFIEENGEELSSIESDAYEMMAVMSHSEELSDMRSRFQKGGKVDMCKALKDWMEESRLEGRAEGEAAGLERGHAEGETRFAALTEKLLEEKRTEDLSRAVNDVNYRAVLYREFRI